MEWKMNEKQAQFVGFLKDNREGLTLREIKSMYGVELKTGSINTLVSKGFVNTDEKRTFVADIVYQGEVIGHKTYNDTVYKLVNNDNE